MFWPPLRSLGFTGIATRDIFMKVLGILVFVQQSICQWSSFPSTKGTFVKDSLRGDNAHTILTSSEIARKVAERHSHGLNFRTCLSYHKSPDPCAVVPIPALRPRKVPVFPSPDIVLSHQCGMIEYVVSVSALAH